MSQKPYNPELFLELADKLIYDSRYDEKSRSRIVVGRAYYTAFLKAQKKLGELGISLTDEARIHKQAIDALRSLKPDLGDKFSTLFDKRVDADYHMNEDVRKETGKWSIKTAQLVIKEIDALKKK